MEHPTQENSKTHTLTTPNSPPKPAEKTPKVVAYLIYRFLSLNLLQQKNVEKKKQKEKEERLKAAHDAQINHEIKLQDEEWFREHKEQKKEKGIL